LYTSKEGKEGGEGGEGGREGGREERLEKREAGSQIKDMSIKCVQKKIKKED